MPEVQPVENTLVSALKARDLSLAAAESCTGGLIACRITDVPGASAVFLGGIVAYANAVKMKQLQVAEDILIQDGAVSEACARAMASGAAQALSADCAMAVTGIAGPDGGTPEKPVGLVYIATAYAEEIKVTENHFSGTRASIKTQTADTAMKQLLSQLEG